MRTNRIALRSRERLPKWIQRVDVGDASSLHNPNHNGMDDPWGSSNEPWAAKAPADDPMRPPASFLMPDDLPGAHSSTDMPTVRRKASVASDPWGSTEAATEDDGSSWRQPGGEDDAAGLASPSARSAAEPSWMEEDLNAWDKPADSASDVPSESEAQDQASPSGDPVIPLQSTSVAEAVDLDSPPRSSADGGSSPFEAAPQSPPSVPFPRMSTSSPGADFAATQDYGSEEEDQNPFGRPEHHASPFASPAHSHLSTPRLGSNLAVPASINSPQFSDGGFGGFAGPTAVVDDAWGSPQVPQDTWGQMELSSPGHTRAAIEQDTEEGEVDAWGASVGPRKPFDEDETAVAAPTSAASDVVQDWDAARREVEQREARAPSELVAKLQKAWPSLVMQAFDLVEGEGKGRAGDDEELPRLEPAVVAKRDRLMSEMTVRPSTLDYLVPYSSTQTYARASTALAQLPIDPSASLLAQAERRTERSGGTTIDQLEKEWNTRSMLGEPDNDARQPALPSPMDPRRPGWSLFGRKASHQGVPLTTSGGGLLQLKPMDPVSAPARHSGESHRTTQSDSQAVAAVPALPVNAIKSASAAAVTSRPASPAASASAATSAAAVDAESESGGSAVGRFFGRFRKKAASPSVDLSNKDMQLSTDDFSFLDQVPAASATTRPAEHGSADLLGGGPGPSDNLESLEAMLSGSTQRPPVTLGVVPIGKRGSSRQVPKLDLPPPPVAKPSAMDLFGDLDFTSTGPVAQPTAAPAARAPSASIGPAASTWDDFLSGNSSPPGVTPAMGKQNIPPAAQPHGTRPGSAASANEQPPGALAPTTSAVVAEDDDGFGDFGSFDQAGPIPGKVNQASLDDFGDFFATTSSAKVTARSTVSGRPSLPPLNGTQGSGAMSSGQSDAALHGRWPAPASPIPPLLAPPPAGAPKAGSFDFFGNDSGPASGVSLLPPPPSSSSRPPSRSPSATLAPPSAPAPRAMLSAQSKGGQGGLSAQDLSFFDSL